MFSWKISKLSIKYQINKKNDLYANLTLTHTSMIMFFIVNFYKIKIWIHEKYKTMLVNYTVRTSISILILI